MCQRGLEAVSIAVEAGRNAVDSFPLVVIASLIGSGVQRLQVRSPRLAQAEKSDFVGQLVYSRLQNRLPHSIQLQNIHLTLDQGHQVNLAKYG